MDYLRSCYSSQIYSFDPSTGAMVATPIEWYFAPSGALELGVHHQYASQVWTRPTRYMEQVGEVVNATRVYSKGPTPDGLTGQNYCGEDWTGRLVRLTTPLPSRPDGQPSCCAGTTYACSNCPGGEGLDHYNISAVGGTGQFAALNGTVAVPWVNPCDWEGDGPLQVVGLRYLGPGNLQITLEGSVAIAQYRWTGPWDCQSDIPSGWNLFSSSGTGTPPTVSLTVLP